MTATTTTVFRNDAVTKLSLKRRIFNLIALPFQFFFRNANSLNVLLLELANPIYTQHIQGKQILFSCPNHKVLWRARTLLTKEPETIDWIDTFSPNDILFDVGANIGVYTLYAAAKGIKCYSFEPESQNYALLNKNIYINSFDKNVCAFNVALSDHSTSGELNLNEFLTGAALHSFGSTTDLNKNSFAPQFRQGVMSFSLDDLVFKYNLPCPNHIKIDVDGIERLIINGGKNLFADKRVKSIHIELNDNLTEDMEIKTILQNCGFQHGKKAHATSFDQGSFSQLYNYTFIRS